MPCMVACLQEYLDSCKVPSTNGLAITSCTDNRWCRLCLPVVLNVDHTQLHACAVVPVYRLV